MRICHKHPFQYFHHHLVHFERQRRRSIWLHHPRHAGWKWSCLVACYCPWVRWDMEPSYGSFWGRDVRLAVVLWWSDPSSGNTRDIHSRGGAKIPAKYRQNTIQHNLMCVVSLSLSLSLSKYDICMLYCMYYVLHMLGRSTVIKLRMICDVAATVKPPKLPKPHLSGDFPWKSLLGISWFRMD